MQSNPLKIFILILSILFLTACGQSNASDIIDSSFIDTSIFQKDSYDDSFNQFYSDAGTYKPSWDEYEYMNNTSDIITNSPPYGYDVSANNIKYPRFKKYSYYSYTRGRTAYVNVLLPRDLQEDKKYPVVYFLHGYGKTEDSLTEPEMALSEILTNLQLKGEAKDMIIVLPYVYCSREHEIDPGLSLESLLCYDNFINDLLYDLMPYINENFPVATGKENTAISGFSMGGREAMYIGFMHPEIFGFIGAAAPAPGLIPVEDSDLRPGQMQPYEMRYYDDIPYLYLISSSLADGAVKDTPDQYRKIMTNNNVQFLSQVMTSAHHGENIVKPHLYVFFKMIFR